jgi:hypothetical protein
VGEEVGVVRAEIELLEPDAARGSGSLVRFSSLSSEARRRVVPSVVNGRLRTMAGLVSFLELYPFLLAMMAVSAVAVPLIIWWTGGH